MSTYEEFDESVIGSSGWEIISYLPYSIDLAPGDFHLFGTMKVHVGGRKYQTDMNSGAMP
jgi:hypothetical protein